MSKHQPAQRLAEFLPYQLSIASNAVSTRIAEQYRKRFALKTTEWRIMAVLGDHGALTQRELSQQTLMDKVPVNRACKRLEQRGLAQRSPNASDGRSHLLELTLPDFNILLPVVGLRVRGDDPILFAGFHDLDGPEALVGQ